MLGDEAGSDGDRMWACLCVVFFLRSLTPLLILVTPKVCWECVVGWAREKVRFEGCTASLEADFPIAA